MTLPLVEEFRALREQVEARIVEWRRSPAAWDAAAQNWLQAQASKHTRAAYQTALRQFARWRTAAKEWPTPEGVPGIAAARPWTVTAQTVRDWRAALLADDLAASTVKARLAALSSFFRFCQEQCVYVDEALLVRRALVDANPVDGVGRPTVKPQPKVALSVEQVRALLAAPDQHAVAGLRNRALLIMYLLTGQRNSEIRRLQWGDLRVEDGVAYYCWAGKGGTGGEQTLPAPAYNAIRAYLEAAGRLDTMSPDDYIFAPLEDVAERLPHVEETQGPISRQRVAQIIKSEALKAGLRPDLISTHTLRRTAARRFYEASGHDLDRTQKMLHHSQAKTTSIYLNQPERETDDVWLTVAEMYGL